MSAPVVRLSAFAALLLAAFALAPLHASAQTFDTGFADFGSDQSSPIEIEADELEVQDKSNAAIFKGNVVVKQEQAALQTSTLTVYYSQSAMPASGENPSTPQNQRISRLEASGRVLITADGQSATGDAGVVNFDDRTLSLTGNVTLTQDGNVVTGDKLTVSLDTGVASVQSSSRVRVLLNPGGNK
ncbi:LptA/OstA family protein [Acuticoccus sp. MNP-M23]|uniref:LptA/OstA family protein n=1 Tax=Acuticoccus sp. MNP-M23 TaxID=3072793 RepID=UPI0028152148|nr:LptA/OstA family protein [Acuticoccus sp. MNP-M23]WMS43759.1 LptA/OstA family protein [Acuticoccus sp. MNP-M23]